MRRYLVIAALALCSVAAHAHDTINIRGVGPVSYEHLFEERSQPGESLEDFVLRVGPRMRAWSDQTGYESCGLLATDGTQYGIVVGTNHSHMACVNTNRFLPAGMESMRLTFHSHGRNERFKPNVSDMRLMGQLITGSKNPRIHTVFGQLADDFSDADYDTGPGYLAGSNGRVWYQGGRGTKQTEVTR